MLEATANQPVLSPNDILFPLQFYSRSVRPALKAMFPDAPAYLLHRVVGARARAQAPWFSTVPVGVFQGCLFSEQHMAQGTTIIEEVPARAYAQHAEDLIGLTMVQGDSVSKLYVILHGCVTVSSSAPNEVSGDVRVCAA